MQRGGTQDQLKESVQRPMLKTNKVGQCQLVFGICARWRIFGWVGLLACHIAESDSNPVASCTCKKPTNAVRFRCPDHCQESFREAKPKKTQFASFRRFHLFWGLSRPHTRDLGCIFATPPWQFQAHVFCDLGHLGWDGLVGSIPSSISSLQQLQWLKYKDRSSLGLVCLLPLGVAG